MSKPSRVGALVGALLLSLYWAPIANAQHADPSGRVARFSDTDGDISYSPAGEDDWISVVRNRPLITGDRLWTDSDARGEMQVGSAAVRLGPDTSVEILELDDSIAQFRLTQGTLNLRVRRMDSGQVYEVATPTLAFTVNRPGRYRIDVDARDQHTTIVVWEGAGTAYGESANFPRAGWRHRSLLRRRFARLRAVRPAARGRLRPLLFRARPAPGPLGVPALRG